MCSNSKLAENFCRKGYNSNNFDDEVTRSTLHRNLLNPFSGWEKDRWDIIKLVRAVRDFKPDTLVLDTNDPETGNTSFRLPDVVAQNGIEQKRAHDALFDVLATIGIAKRIKAVQPELYNWFFSHRRTDEVRKLFKYEPRQQILLYTHSSPVNAHFTTHPIFPLFYQRSMNGDLNKVIAYDLSCEVPDELNDENRKCLIEINLKKCPFLTTGKLNDEMEKRAGVTWAACLERRNLVLASPLFMDEKKCSITYEKGTSDPDIDIYGGFASYKAKHDMAKIWEMNPCERLKNRKPFNGSDSRYNEILFRYVARNHPEVLSDDERKEWYDHCRCKIMGRNDSTPARTPLYIDGYFSIIDELENRYCNDEVAQNILSDLREYGIILMNQLNIKSEEYGKRQTKNT